MSIRTNSFIIRLRNLGRKIGINELISNIISNKGYELNFDESFRKQLKSGYCVWDVGANVGYYTKLFAQIVGKNGIVHAFEPSNINFNKLEENCLELSNVICHPFGIGDEVKSLNFIQGTDELGATSRFSDNQTGGKLIEIKSGEYLISEKIVPSPNAIKIDVEGFEYEVIEGLKNNLKVESLHVIGIEMHFKLLMERGKSDAASKIENILRHNGFKVRWTDTSHILATKK